nr:bone marrow proteoglycan-like [Loxodonta africana]
MESVSALAEVDNDFQCPKEEDTVKLEGSPGCRPYRFLLVRCPRNFNHAQIICQRCYRGSLVSIHNYNFNYQIQSDVRFLNQGQVWIGGRVTSLGHYRHFYWMDGSSWNFAYWLPAIPGQYWLMCDPVYPRRPVAPNTLRHSTSLHLFLLSWPARSSEAPPSWQLPLHACLLPLFPHPPA